jgi:acyl dehydratase
MPQDINYISLEEFPVFLGKEIGVSDWHTVTQEQINTFAAATIDHQWIHTDPERAAQSNYKTTIAHGFLTLSMAPYLMAQIFQVKGQAMGINYGLNSVRFGAPVPVDSKLRLKTTLNEFVNRGNIATLTIGLIFEIEGGKKPVCEAEYLVLVKK